MVVVMVVMEPMAVMMVSDDGEVMVSPSQDNRGDTERKS